ncbi:M50 family metallopeptidase [Nonomuraea roseola]|uniref:M50 family metallopeptidase n=1 Tax=Nonomuraea roseola TaxID=46179 RepID=A0ABV5Q6A9_9ACTN
MRPGDENRVFHRKKWWQKVIMSGGPAMNFVLAFVFSAILLVGIGLPAEAPMVSPATHACVIPVSEQRAACKPGDQPTPAAQAGLKPGDHMVSFNRATIGSWDDAISLVRSHGASRRHECARFAAAVADAQRTGRQMACPCLPNG